MIHLKMIPLEKLMLQVSPPILLLEVMICQDEIFYVHFFIFFLSLMSDPFGGDPFKGSDPFAADSLFAQTSSTTFSSEDPFSVPADPFGTTPGIPEPDLFAAKLKDTASAPAAAVQDPFASKTTNPAPSSKDPFTSTGTKKADSDLFGGKVNTSGEVDPFSSQDGGTDPFSSSSPTSDLALVSGSSEKLCCNPHRLFLSFLTMLENLFYYSMFWFYVHLLQVLYI